MLGGLFGKGMSKGAAWARGAAASIGSWGTGVGHKAGAKIKGTRVAQGIQSAAGSTMKAGMWAHSAAPAIGGIGGAVYGFATGEGSAERWQRAAAFGVMGGLGGKTIKNTNMRLVGSQLKGAVTGRGINRDFVPEGGPFRRVLQGYVKKDGQFFRKSLGLSRTPGKAGTTLMKPVSGLEARMRMGKGLATSVGEAFGPVTPLRGMAAGAVYSMTDEDMGIVEGATAGLFGVAGFKMMRGGLTKAAGQWGTVRNAGTFGGKFQAAMKMPLMQMGAGAGIMAGAYAGMDEEGILGVAGSTLKGALIGGGAAGIGKFAAAHPLMALTGLGGTAIVGGSAAQAYSEWEGYGRPGMNDMEADGDLALALHKMRHGF